MEIKINKKLVIMYRFYIFILACFFLVACQKREVTEAMLIGNWHCKTLELKGNDPHMSYDYQIDYVLTFFNDPKFGLTQSYNKGTPIPIIFKTYSRIENKGISGKVLIINEDKYVYISDNEFHIISSNKIPKKDGDLYFSSKTACVRTTN